MLILSRKASQRIRIGDDVEVVVVAIDGDQVKLGVEAPRRVLVLRSELLDAVRDENRRAAAPPAIPVGLGALLGRASGS
jgi:carbon storage regulator